ncbi:hypothetical protein JW796_03500 [Candidatus Dojkabacteria bacterium]|nr:hypothetical protein [Candidatus Dojkabacteria bacterium]
MKKFLAISLAFALVLASSFFTYSEKAEAAGVAVTATPSAVDLSTATDVTFTWTASAAVEAAGTTFTFSASPALPSAFADCSTPDTQADTVSGGSGSFGSFSTTNATFTTTSATTTTGRSLCLRVPSIATAASYSVTVGSSSANNDYGAVLLYVGGDNQVTVTASVGSSLSFNIRTVDDTADTNVCNLGNVSTLTTAPNGDAAVDGPGECGYGLAIGTNAEGGFQAQIIADGPLNNASAAITDIADNGTFVSGTETYGLDNVRGALTGRSIGGTYDQPITVDSPVGYTFNTGSTPVPTTAQNFVSYASGIQYIAGSGADDLTLVIHGLTVGSGTAIGSYDQLVTYTVTPTF